jgi:hypothetical protein
LRPCGRTCSALLRFRECATADTKCRLTFKFRLVALMDEYDDIVRRCGTNRFSRRLCSWMLGAV